MRLNRNIREGYATAHWPAGSMRLFGLWYAPIKRYAWVECYHIWSESIFHWLQTFPRNLSLHVPYASIDTPSHSPYSHTSCKWHLVFYSRYKSTTCSLWVPPPGGIIYKVVSCYKGCWINSPCSRSLFMTRRFGTCPSLLWIASEVPEKLWEPDCQ